MGALARDLQIGSGRCVKIRRWSLARNGGGSSPTVLFCSRWHGSN